MNTFFEQVYKHLLQVIATISPHQPPRLLLGLSGGADSVFLLHLLLHARTEKKLDFIAGHLNHQWRTDADDTVAFCKILCEKNKVPFFVDMLETYKPYLINTGSSEDLGRQARLLFFKKISEEQNIRWRVLGHHFDDQIESFFIKLIRGTTVEGISGIQTITENTIRPLLSFSKNHILQYLKEYNYTWHHDSTNDSDEYLRNSIRSHLIPMLQKIDPRSFANIRRFQVHAALDSDYFMHETESALERITSKKSDVNQTVYMRSLFLKEHPALQKRILTKLLYLHQYQGTVSEGIILEIIRFLMHNQGGEHTIKHLVIHKKQDAFWLTP